MHKNLNKFLQAVVAFPVLAMSFTGAPFPGVTVGSPLAAAISPDQTRTLATVLADNQQQLLSTEATKVDEYFASRHSPLVGQGSMFVKVALENGLPYDTLVGIATVESDADLMPCKNDQYNIFGYNSCHGTDFTSFDDAINTVGATLGANNPDTASFYANKTLNQKLRVYNGPVKVANPLYVEKVLWVMDQVDKMPVSTQTTAAQTSVVQS